MKVIVKLRGHTEIVENVSVDEKCCPLVGGVHPYPEASQQDSHLANQSALWFKTLAIDCIFVDCDKSEVHWFPMVSEANPDVGVILRKSRPDRYESRFLLSLARPLFEDATILEMDPSLKGMMLTCSEAMRKLSAGKLGKTEFNRAVASILHVYILPSIAFSAGDLYCLSRTRCLVEDRLNNAENMIKCVVESIDRLETCLNTLRSNLLFRENLESEEYLQTCNSNFLRVFVKNLEDFLVSLNLGLETQQSKVNWAKQHEDGARLAELKATRDKMHADIVQLIRIREAIRNVTVRKDFFKTKKSSKRRKKAVEVASCFHDVFVEVVRRLEAENKTLERLCQDKLNISAAREATMSAIMQLDNNNRVSERTTTFEPEDFVDYSIDVDSASKKSDLWPTFQERVNAILAKSSSKSRLVHVEGCKSLSSRIDLALSEFNLAVSSGARSEHDSQNRLGVSRLPGVEMRNSSPSTNLQARRNSRNLRNTVCTGGEEICVHAATLTLAPHGQVLPSQEVDLDVSETKVSVEVQNDGVEAPQRNVSNISQTVPSSDDQEGDTGFEPGPNLQRNRQRQRVNEKLALASLLRAVDEIKLALQAHFREMVASLSLELDDLDLGLDTADQKELLWKSYERIFMASELARLTDLYATLLRPGAQRTHATLSTSPLQAILQEDKILELFYGPSRCSSPVTPRDLEDDKKFSMARTLSEPSLDVRRCPIDELYTLANADSSDIQRRFGLESSGEDSDLPSSSDSSCSSKDRVSGVWDFSVGFSGQSGLRSDVTGSEPALRSSPVPVHLSQGSNSVTHSAGDEDGMVAPDQVLMIPGLDDDVTHSPALSASNSQAQQFESSLSSFASSTSLNDNEDEDRTAPEKLSRDVSPRSSHTIISRLETVIAPFRKSVRKCLEATSLMDKMRYIGRAIQGLNRQLWQLMGAGEQASCDDILSTLVVTLCHMPEEIFVGLYVNVRMLMDVWPPFLDGTLWNCSLVNLYASYDFLFTHSVCEKAVRDYSGSLRIKF
ncbi:hypothetical protein EGW08_022823 [Elysia chlorotica]|uniref:Uncharacterized protein n=1 Tax=Elysia chlorotica TaxID=188477 RepID=A0A433SK11_ELYCH|nr:hypothetical protein EGW08_022823 [Elysia chlorotica]